MPPKTFTAQLRDFADRTKADMLAVAQESIQDVVEAAQTSQRGVTKGATSFVIGKIPVAEGDLINSLVSGVNGAFGPPSKASYVTVIAGMELSDYLRFAWTMEYAQRIELGFSGEDALGRTYDQKGRHFVGANARRFSQFVEKNAAKRGRA